VIGYRDLAKLALAVERDVAAKPAVQTAREEAVIVATA